MKTQAHESHLKALIYTLWYKQYTIRQYGCSTVGRAGGLVVRRSQVRSPGSPGWNRATCRSSKILDPKVAPDVQMPSVRVQGEPCPLCETGFGPLGRNGNIPATCQSWHSLKSQLIMDVKNLDTLVFSYWINWINKLTLKGQHSFLHFYFVFSQNSLFILFWKR